MGIGPKEKICLAALLPGRRDEPLAEAAGLRVVGGDLGRKNRREDDGKHNDAPEQGDGVGP